jgi:DNA-binding transcriptional ArsR family regulator
LALPCAQRLANEQRGHDDGRDPVDSLDGPGSFVHNLLVMDIGGPAISSTRLDVTFAALADPTRRAILARLAQGEASVAELTAPFEMSQPAISKHLKVLEKAGLISRGRDAQRRPRKLEAQPLAQANAWLEDYRKIWEANYQRLDDLLEELQAEEASRSPKQPKSKRKRKGATR